MTRSPEYDKPRVWPSLMVGIGALVVAGIVTNAILYLVVSPTLGPGQSFGQEAIGAWMQQNMATVSGFLTIVVPLHAALLLLCLIAAMRSRTRLVERLGLTRSRIPITHYPILMLGSLGAAALSGWLFLSHISPGEDQIALARTFAQMRGIGGMIIVLYTAIVATFVEELLFRGFVLRGLVRRWKPIYAIALASILFMLIHPSPFFMLHVLPLGIWWGIVTWRTDSIWPAIACHSFTNIALAGLNRAYPEPTVAFFGELSPWPIGIGVFGILMLGISLWMLFGRPRSG